METETARPSDPQVPSRKAGFFQELSIEFLIHELKDPIAIIETGLRALLEKQEQFGPLTPRQANTLARSLRNTRKAWGLLNALLEIGRSEAGCFACRRFSPKQGLLRAMREALETVVGPSAEALGTFQDPGRLKALLESHGLFLQVAPAAETAEALQDETKFVQICGNLVKNALHHRRERVEVRLEVSGAFMDIAVADDGPGIDPAHHELIFRRYTQVQECSRIERKGHGLGLAGSLVLARALGGDIRVVSRKGEGARFQVTLPLRFPGLDGETA